jgi:predicted amidophosphoribosyltransferase
MDRLIWRLKYGGVLSHARLLGELAGHALRRTFDQVDALVPVPPHRKRLRKRGFDQVLEIGRYLRAVVGLPLLPGMCVRRVETPPLWPLGPSERRRILRGAFECCGTPPERVAVLDDILTTGATADAMATVLRAAGARHVEVWAVARSPTATSGPVQVGTRA